MLNGEEPPVLASRREDRTHARHRSGPDRSHQDVALRGENGEALSPVRRVREETSRETKREPKNRGGSPYGHVTPGGRLRSSGIRSFDDGDASSVDTTVTSTTHEPYRRLRRDLQVRWMNTVLPESLRIETTEDLPGALCDGIVLCHLLRHLCPRKADRMKHRMFAKARTPKIAKANIEIALRLIYTERSVRCTAIPSAAMIRRGTSRRRTHSLMQEIFRVFVIRKMIAKRQHWRCLEWWNDVLERHPYGRAMTPRFVLQIRDRHVWPRELLHRTPSGAGEEEEEESVARTLWNHLRDGSALACVLHWYSGDDGCLGSGLPPVDSSRLCAVRSELNFSTDERRYGSLEHYVENVREVFELYEEIGVPMLFTAEEWVSRAYLCPDFLLLQLDLIRERLDKIENPRTSTLWGRPVVRPRRVPMVSTPSSIDGKAKKESNEKCSQTDESPIGRSVVEDHVESSDNEDETLDECVPDALIASAIRWISKTRAVAWCLVDGSTGSQITDEIEGIVHVTDDTLPMRLHFYVTRDETKTSGKEDVCGLVVPLTSVKSVHMESNDTVALAVDVPSDGRRFVRARFENAGTAETFFGSVRITRRFMGRDQPAVKEKETRVDSIGLDPFE